MTLVLILVMGVAGFFLLKIIDWIAPDLSLKFLLNFVYAAFTESFYLIAVTALYGNDLQRRNPKSLSNKDQTPVLFIHGLYHNSSGWWKYLKIFQEAQIEPLFTMNLGSPFGSINQHAYRINEMVDHIQKVTGRKDIILVGHSMGGLAATKFALDLATEDTRVISIVTLGSPLKGTWVANYLGWGESVKEMRMNSPYALSLSEKICKNEKIHFFHIAARPDLMVPLSSALLLENKKAKHLILPDLGHLGLLFSRSVIDATIDYYHESINNYRC